MFGLYAHRPTVHALWGSTAVLLGAVVAGCATTDLSRQDVVRQYDEVAELSRGLEDARGREGSLLAPKHFEKAERLLETAIQEGKHAQKSDAVEAASKGLEELERLDRALRENQAVMSAVLDQRTRARQQGAAVLFDEEFAEIDDELRSAARQLEEGKNERARDRRPGLIDRYAQLELRALKKGTVEAAEQAIAAAAQAGADLRAPSTLQQARDELQLALSVLDADRTMVEKSNEHARRSTWLARRAHEMTRLQKEFDAEGYSMEDVLLWYQNQLQRVRGAINDEALPFDQPNPQVIEAMRKDLLALQSALENAWATHRSVQTRAQGLEAELEQQRRAHEEELQAMLAQHEQQLAALESGRARQLARAQREASAEVERLKARLSAQAMAQAEEKRREERARARFEGVQALFEPSEAEVYRKGDDVLIRLQGFDFPPGKYQIDSRNYPLLNKIVAAIGHFPEASVRITGHTDSQGSDELNLRLSSARAESVLQFLTTVGGIASKRLEAEGMGEKEPVASNETAEGRAQNRRIDVLIMTKAPKLPST